MSNATFPDLRGLAWEYTLASTFSTAVQQATNGREVRAAFWSAPLWKISLTYNYLHDDAQRRCQRILGAAAACRILLARQGQFGSFLIDLAQLTRKPLDSTVSGQPIGTGDGSTIVVEKWWRG